MGLSVFRPHSPLHGDGRARAVYIVSDGSKINKSFKSSLKAVFNRSDKRYCSLLRLPRRGPPYKKYGHTVVRADVQDKNVSGAR